MKVLKLFLFFFLLLLFYLLGYQISSDHIGMCYCSYLAAISYQNSLILNYIALAAILQVWSYCLIIASTSTLFFCREEHQLVLVNKEKEQHKHFSSAASLCFAQFFLAMNQNQGICLLPPYMQYFFLIHVLNLLPTNICWHCCFPTKFV